MNSIGARCKPLLPITKTRMLKFALPAAAVLLTLAVAGAFAVRGEYLSFILSFIPLVTAVFMLGTAPGFWRGLNRPLNNKTRWAFQLHAFRSAVVGVTALSLVFMSLDISGKFFFVVLAFSMPYLFFGIPGTAGLIHVLIKDQPDAAVFRESGTVWASRLITHVSWAGSAAVIVLAVAVFQPWPFSLREGPDTEWTRGGFEQTFGFAPPASVEELYCAAASLSGNPKRSMQSSPTAMTGSAGRFSASCGWRKGSLAAIRKSADIFRRGGCGECPSTTTPLWSTTTERRLLTQVKVSGSAASRKLSTICTSTDSVYEWALRQGQADGIPAHGSRSPIC